MLLSISLILIVGMFMGWLCQKCRLPSLLGMLATGMVLGPYVLNLLDGSILGISPELRACAVCGKAFLPEGRQAYCSDVCKAEGNRRKSRERMRKMREKRPGGCYDLPPPKA